MASATWLGEIEYSPLPMACCSASTLDWRISGWARTWFVSDWIRAGSDEKRASSTAEVLLNVLLDALPDTPLASVFAASVFCALVCAARPGLDCSGGSAPKAVKSTLIKFSNPLL